MKTIRYPFFLGMTLLLVVALVGFTHRSVKPGVVYEIETTTYDASEPKTETNTVHVLGPHLLKVKVSVSPLQGKPDGTGTLIFRGDRKEMLIIDHKEQAYLVFDEELITLLKEQMGGIGEMIKSMAMSEEMMKSLPEEQRKEMEEVLKKMQQGDGQAEKTTEVRKTNEKSTQQGYPCNLYEVYENDQKTSELWVTDWDNIEGGDEVADVMVSFAEFVQSMMEAFTGALGLGELAKNRNPLEGFSEVDGFPVVVRNLKDGQLESETILRSAQRENLDPADFEPPAGYEQQTMDMR